MSISYVNTPKAHLPSKITTGYFPISCLHVGRDTRRYSKNGGLDVSKAKKLHEQDRGAYQSTEWLYSLRLSCSGARYSAVPQKVAVRCPGFKCFDSPKSVSAMWPMGHTT